MTNNKQPQMNGHHQEIGSLNAYRPVCPAGFKV
jgi:hypothetical protein